MATGINYGTVSNVDLQKLCDTRGIEYDPNDFIRGDIMARLKTYDDEQVTIIEEQAVAAGEKVVTIIIYNTSEEDLPYVYVSVNERTWNIPREIAVPVPQCVLDNLDNAVETRVVRTFDPIKGSWVSRSREVRRFNYQIVG